MKLKRHPLSALFSQFDLAGADLDNLAADIQEHGQQEPIKLHDGMVLDGWNRYQACLQAKVDPLTIDFECADPWAYVVSINIARRHLTPSQIAAVYLLKEETVPTGTPASVPTGTPSVRKIAKELGVSRGAAERITKIAKDGAPEVKQAVIKGEASISRAAEIAKLPSDQQAQALAQPERRQPKEPALTPEQQLIADAYGDLDPIEEWEKATNELAAANRTIESLQADDKGKEIARLNSVVHGLQEQLAKAMARADNLAEDLGRTNRIVTELVRLTGVDHPKKLVAAVKELKKVAP